LHFIDPPLHLLAIGRPRFVAQVAPVEPDRFIQVAELPLALGDVEQKDRIGKEAVGLLEILQSLLELIQVVVALPGRVARLRLLLGVIGPSRPSDCQKQNGQRPA
jgi:hypothetical protein